MTKFSNMLSVVACLCAISCPAWARTPVEETTRFFRTHRSAININKTGESILLANRQIGLEIKQTPRGFQLGRIYDT